MYCNFGQKILREKFNFRGILNLDVQNGTGSNQALKTRPGFGHMLKPGSGSDRILKLDPDPKPCFLLTIYLNKIVVHRIA